MKAHQKISKILSKKEIEKIDFDKGLNKRFILGDYVYFINIHREELIYRNLKLTKKEYQKDWCKKKRAKK